MSRIDESTLRKFLAAAAIAFALGAEAAPVAPGAPNTACTDPAACDDAARNPAPSSEDAAGR